jgi:hypothetical protein
MRKLPLKLSPDLANCRLSKGLRADISRKC